MTIRGDSYGSVAEVVAFTRYLLDGQTSYNSTTRPTLTEVEKMIDRASGVLNVAISSHGFITANVTANSTAKLACDDWVTARVAEHVELTQRGAGYNESDDSRTRGFRNIHRAATTFVKDQALGWKRLGVTATHPLSEGLTFTGQDTKNLRSDPDDSSLEQPKFLRGLWDDSSLGNSTTSGED